ncbi:TetR/AcrR family transcriptional regulator [Clostridium swellfunianum]|uniref:TetR/AcrR family transcriptional regulator n=1 Tax=Clostridium swellfunianum TaxID=1367462 RepID=UPI0020304E87|nr:TetR/AcrR family transcriptional regulator [Clostridium swellfunianum]MCM0647234.1 TetR/AcrR family transcriptional regulator [Clostridium swellfunianum]
MELSTKQKIILATIGCIEKEGINAVTIRSIGKEANVNSAAINYHFGSKEKLIEEAFDYIQKDFMMDFTEIINKDMDLRKIVEELLLYILQGTIRYPNIVKAVLYEPFFNNNYNGVFINKLNALCEELCRKVNKQPASDKEKNKIAVIQLTASSLFMGIFPCIFKDFSNIDLRDENMLKEYIKTLSDIFVNAIIGF